MNDASSSANSGIAKRFASSETQPTFGKGKRLIQFSPSEESGRRMVKKNVRKMP
jgi:hypothetical protein